MTASAAAAAGYTLAAGPVRAQAVTTDTTGLKVGEAKVKVAGGEMPVYFARPEKAKNPPVVLVAMEIFGLHEYIKDVTRRLAKAGALCDRARLLLPLRPGSHQDHRNAEADADREREARRRAARRSRRDGGVGEVAGRQHAAGSRSSASAAAAAPCGSTRRTTRTCSAGVAFYGSLVDPPAQKEGGKWPKSPTELAADIKAPVLGLYGEADQGIPVAQVEAMKEALAKAKKKTEFKIYPGAPHGFHADYRPSYRKEAAEDAWKMALDWLKKNKVL